ncbi:MAG: hypothetical protein AAB518_02160 [Patescibacteria group bacterium]
MKETPELTICSVYHSDMARRILEMNEIFVRRMNPGSSWIRFAANNSQNENIHIQDNAIRELPGGIIPGNAPPKGREGYHYGAALNALLPHIQTRFVLFLDYDFFIVRPNWIRDVILHMKQNGLSLFGAPYHPKYWVKFRHFPVQYCLFVDREKIGDAFLTWNFTPQYSEAHLIQGDASEAAKKIYKAKNPTPTWFERIRDNIRKRKYIGTSQDMSYDLYRRYAQKSFFKYETFGSTVTLNDFLVHYYVNEVWYKLLYLLEKMIPERWSFVPRNRGGYFTFTRFRDRNLPDVLGTGMEEWWWKNAPMAFHMRGFKERRAQATGKAFNPEENIQAIQEITEKF